MHRAAAIVLASIALAACSSRPAPASMLIGPSGGTVAVGEVTLTIPPGALSAPVTITITRTDDAPPTGYIGYSPVYRFEPRGIVFASPVTVSFQHSASARAPRVVWSDSAETTWTDLPSTDASDLTGRRFALQ